MSFSCRGLKKGVAQKGFIGCSVIKHLTYGAVHGVREGWVNCCEEGATVIETAQISVNHTPRPVATQWNLLLAIQLFFREQIDSKRELLHPPPSVPTEILHKHTVYKQNMAGNSILCWLLLFWLWLSWIYRVVMWRFVNQISPIDQQVSIFAPVQFHELPPAEGCWADHKNTVIEV